MKHNLQQYKGDITLFVTIMVSATMLILLLALSQKVTVESRISRENMYSQQALQAANTGLDAWQYQWVQKGTIDITIPLKSTWPNSSTIGETIKTDSSGKEWIELSNVGVSSIQYRVEFQAGNTLVTPPILPLIITKGKVVRGNTIIERTLEQQFNKISANCGSLNHSATRTQSCPASKPIGSITEQCNDGVIKEISNTCRELTQSEAQIRCNTLYNLRSRTSCNGVPLSGGIAYSAVKRSGIWKCELTQAWTAYSGYADTCAGTSTGFEGTCTDPGVISSICSAEWGVPAGTGSSVQGFQPGGTETCGNGKYHINVNCVWPTGTGPVKDLP